MKCIVLVLWRGISVRLSIRLYFCYWLTMCFLSQSTQSFQDTSECIIEDILQKEITMQT